MSKFYLLYILVICLASVSQLAFGKNQQLGNPSSVNQDPTLEQGAKVYWNRCVICHGEQGMGEGMLPLRLKSYPKTNLLQAKKTATVEQIHRVIALGSNLDYIGDYMPPMGNELTWTEIASVSQFVAYLRKDTKGSLSMLKDIAEQAKAVANLGKMIYQTRCVLCHDKNGTGKGRMAKVISNPPPFNLTQSQMPKAYLEVIISRGGEGVGRSAQMPPWGDQLSEKEVKAVAEYIYGLRKQSHQ